MKFTIVGIFSVLLLITLVVTIFQKPDWFGLGGTTITATTPFPIVTSVPVTTPIPIVTPGTTTLKPNVTPAIDVNSLLGLVTAQTDSANSAATTANNAANLIASIWSTPSATPLISNTTIAANDADKASTIATTTYNNLITTQLSDQNLAKVTLLNNAAINAKQASINAKASVIITKIISNQAQNVLTTLLNATAKVSASYIDSPAYTLAKTALDNAISSANTAIYDASVILNDATTIISSPIQPNLPRVNNNELTTRIIGLKTVVASLSNALVTASNAIPLKVYCDKADQATCPLNVSTNRHNYSYDAMNKIWHDLGCRADIAPTRPDNNLLADGTWDAMSIPTLVNEMKKYTNYFPAGSLHADPSNAAKCNPLPIKYIKYGPNNNKCITSQMTQPERKTIGLYDCIDDPTQHWMYDETTNQIKPRTDPSTCLTASGPQQSAVITQAPCMSDNIPLTQKWKIQPSPANPGTVKIVSYAAVNNAMCMHLPSGNQGNQAVDLTLWDCMDTAGNDTTAALWNMTI